MKKFNIILYLRILLFSLVASSSLSSQCYQNLRENTGLAPLSLEAAACEVRDALPTEFQNQFRVYDFGTYQHNHIMPGAIDGMWQDVISTAQAGTPYYIVVGRILGNDGYEEYKVDVNLPTTGFFECLNENYLQVLLNTLTTAFNNDKIPSSYEGKFSTGLNNFRIHLSRLNSCCVNGELNENCGCPINLNEADALLESQGYFQISLEETHITEGNYPDISSDYELTIGSFNYTQNLTDLKNDGYTVRLKVIEEDSCNQLLNLDELTPSGIYTEDVIVLLFNDRPQVYFNIIIDDGNKSSQPITIAAFAAALKKLSYTIASGVALDYGFGLIIEKNVGGYNTWTEAIEGYDYGLGDLLYAAKDAASDGGTKKAKLLKDIGEGVGKKVINYITETDPNDWNIEEFTDSFKNGCIEGIFGSALEYVGSKIFKSAIKFFTNIASYEDSFKEEIALICQKNFSVLFKLKNIISSWSKLIDFPSIRNNEANLDLMSAYIDKHPNTTQKNVIEGIISYVTPSTNTKNAFYKYCINGLGCFIQDTPVLVANKNYNTSSNPFSISNAKSLAVAAAMPIVAVPIQDVQLLDYAVAHETVNAGFGLTASVDDDIYLGLLGEDPYTSDQQRERDDYEINNTDWYSVSFEQVLGDLVLPNGGSKCHLALYDDWIVKHDYQLGAVIRLNLPEQGINGPFKITSIKHIIPQKKPEGDAGDGYDWKPITALFEHQSNQVYEISFDNGEELGVTYQHPIYSVTKGDWRLAGELEIGEKVLTKAGETVVVKSEKKEESETVYNLEVKELHNFLVGDSGIVVHNGCGNFKKVNYYHTDGGNKTAIDHIFDQHGSHNTSKSHFASEIGSDKATLEEFLDDMVKEIKDIHSPDFSKDHPRVWLDLTDMLSNPKYSHLTSIGTSSGKATNIVRFVFDDAKNLNPFTIFPVKAIGK